MALGLQYSLFPNLTADFPSTRYQGSKAKIVDWIREQIADLHFATCLDAFGGTGAVSYRLKKAGKQVTYNDLLGFNYYIGLTLVENSEIFLSPEEVDWVLSRHADINYPTFVQDTFTDIYFTDEENFWIDQTLTNIRQFSNPYISKQGVGVDYRDFYHFLEGLTLYDEWGDHIDPQSKHLRLRPQKSEWTDRKMINSAFDRLFRKFADSHLVVSYRSDGIPSESELVTLLKKYKRKVRVEHYGQYKYVLSTNAESKEILLIG